MVYRAVVDGVVVAVVVVAGAMVVVDSDVVVVACVVVVMGRNVVEGDAVGMVGSWGGTVTHTSVPHVMQLHASCPMCQLGGRNRPAERKR